ncbi:MAG: hypothetical protein MUF61_01365 [archaeon]|nr:hypothetical protein [archaeon]
MDKKWWIISAIIVAAIAVAVVLSVNYGAKQDDNTKPAISKGDVPGDTTNLDCQQDSDCVPNACCHPKACTNKENAPGCRGIMCTMNCEPETLDCGQGSCKCENNLCVARFNQ